MSNKFIDRYITVLILVGLPTLAALYVWLMHTLVCIGTTNIPIEQAASQGFIPALLTFVACMACLALIMSLQHLAYKIKKRKQRR